MNVRDERRSLRADDPPAQSTTTHLNTHQQTAKKTAQSAISSSLYQVQKSPNPGQHSSHHRETVIFSQKQNPAWSTSGVEAFSVACTFSILTRRADRFTTSLHTILPQVSRSKTPWATCAVLPARTRRDTLRSNATTILAIRQTRLELNDTSYLQSSFSRFRRLPIQVTMTIK